MWETSVTLQRPEGTTYTGLDGRPATHILVQVDQASDEEVLKHQQITDFHGAVLYKIWTNGWYANSLLRQDDVLIDEQHLDPDTGLAVKYRITGRVKDYPFDHQACPKCEVIPGTA